MAGPYRSAKALPTPPERLRWKLAEQTKTSAGTSRMSPTWSDQCIVDAAEPVTYEEKWVSSHSLGRRHQFTLPINYRCCQRGKPTNQGKAGKQILVNRTKG